MCFSTELMQAFLHGEQPRSGHSLHSRCSCSGQTRGRARAHSRTLGDTIFLKLIAHSLLANIGCEDLVFLPMTLAARQSSPLVWQSDRAPITTIGADHSWPDKSSSFERTTPSHSRLTVCVSCCVMSTACMASKFRVARHYDMH